MVVTIITPTVTTGTAPGVLDSYLSFTNNFAALRRLAVIISSQLGSCKYMRKSEVVTYHQHKHLCFKASEGNREGGISQHWRHYFAGQILWPQFMQKEPRIHLYTSVRIYRAC